MSKHKKSGKKFTSHSIADITINDFANSAVCANRTKKSTTNVNKVLKQLEDDKSWDEKTDDFEGEFIEQENEDGTISYVIQKIEPRRRRKTTSSSEERYENLAGNVYPLDIWFLISEFIQPEDIGRFAGICKSSYRVVSTAKFWFSLYKRYYKSVSTLPERLQPEVLCRKYGIRTQVVRALHYMYSPFISRLTSLERFEQHPDLLKKRKCVLMWHKIATNQVLYYFKMKSNSLTVDRRAPVNTHQPDLLEMLDDVFANQEESCKILQITCKRLIPIAPVLGMILTSSQLNLSSEMRSYKLQLWFGSGIQSFNGTIDGTLVVLEPVINVKVLDWWHPLYPHTHNMGHLCNQE